MQMKNMNTVPCTHTVQSTVYMHSVNEKHEYSALYTYLMQMKNRSTVHCIHA